MKKSLKILVSAAIASFLIGGILPVFADSDAQLKLGKEVFTKKDSKNNACSTCHPKGGTNDSIVDGKKVPNLKKTVGKMSTEKIDEDVRKQAKLRSDLKFTEEELAALVKFVEKLGGK